MKSVTYILEFVILVFIFRYFINNGEEIGISEEETCIEELQLRNYNEMSSKQLFGEIIKDFKKINASKNYKPLEEDCNENKTDSEIDFH